MKNPVRFGQQSDSRHAVQNSFPSSESPDLPPPPHPSSQAFPTPIKHCPSNRNPELEPRRGTPTHDPLQLDLFTPRLPVTRRAA